MADEDFQKEPPQFQKEPPRPEARLEPRPPEDDDNRFRRPEPVWNSMAVTAFRLGTFSVILVLIPVRWPFDLRYIFWVGWLGLAVGPAAVILGILAIRYRNRRPAAGGLGDAVSGLVMGLLTWLFFCGWHGRFWLMGLFR